MRSPATKDLRRDAYIVACARVLTDVMGVVRAQGLAVGIDVDPGRLPFDELTGTHKIRITHGRAKRIVAVDHETFMSSEFFRTLVLHQVKAAIDELAAGQTKG